MGFTVMSIALAILAITEVLAGGPEEHLALVFFGFALFSFFCNAGPNATTYALPAEVFPSDIRAAGHGFAAASAKFGAAIGVFVFPILMADIGEQALLFLLSGVCVLALLVTLVFRIETKGKSLEELSGRSLAEIEPRPTPP